MAIIAIISVSGGVGTTTLTANLATIIGKRRGHVLAVEWDPANRLGFHLGVSDRIDQGWVTAYVNDLAWHERALLNSDQVTFLPFGRLNALSRVCFEQWLVDNPLWLAQRLDSLDLPPGQVVVMDVERGPSVYMTQALRVADLVLAVIPPSPWFKQEIQSFRDQLADAGEFGHKLNLHYVLNFADPTRISTAAYTALMMDNLGEALLPYQVHRDEVVAEALAANQSIFDFAPDSQSSHDLQGLANWVLQRVCGGDMP